MKNATYTDGSPSREWEDSEDSLHDQPTEWCKDIPLEGCKTQPYPDKHPNK